jgi:hypothetical protein
MKFKAWLENVEQYGYRAVPELAFDQIKQQGLVPDWDLSRDPQEFFDLYGEPDDFGGYEQYEQQNGLVLFFAGTEDSARGYGDTMLRFPWPPSAKKVSASSDYYVVPNGIPPQQIEVESNYDWIPIAQAGFAPGRHSNKEIVRVT